MKKLTFLTVFFLIVAFAVSAWATGSWTYISCGKDCLGAEFTGDGSNGTVPDLTITDWGTDRYLYVVEIDPGTPAPTASHTVTITDAYSATLLAATGLSATATSFNQPTINSIPAAVPLKSTITIAVGSNSDAGSKEKILFHLVPK